MLKRQALGPNRVLPTALMVALAPLTAMSPAAAQSFNAGARSLGVGGAYQALADDATAVFWNPAGAATLGIQINGTVGSYARIDERGDKDIEPIPGPSFVGATYGLGANTAIIGAYFSPFVNERRYELFGALPVGTSFQETRVEQFFNRLSLGFAHNFQLGDIGEGGVLPSVAIGGTADLSITSIDGDFFDSNGQRDEIEAREVAPSFTLGLLMVLLERSSFELKLGATYHHPGDFKLDDEGFQPFGRSATASRLYDWPLIAGGGLAIRLLETKSLVLVADYQFVGWREANRNLNDSHNFSFGTEYAFFVSERSQIILRGGIRRLEEPSREDPIVRGIRDHVLAFTTGVGLVYQPRTDAFYAVDASIEVGEGLNYAISLTLGF